MRIHVVWVIGDLPAVKKVSDVKGHNGKRPCRYCLIQGEWCPLRRHMYFPSMLRKTNCTRLQKRFDFTALPGRSEGQSRATIAQIAALTGQPKSQRKIETGITGDSILFRLPNLTPYMSFPIDTMRLFYNIGKDFARLWCGREGRLYELGRNSIRQIDEESARFGNGVASQLGCRPRPLSRFGDWKSAEVKAFITRYSLVVLDGHLSEPYLTGWAKFVHRVDLCWQPGLTGGDIKKVGELARSFYRHFERDYVRYERVLCTCESMLCT